MSIAIDPTNSNVVYVGTAWRGLIVRSTDGGRTWAYTGLGQTGQIVDFISFSYGDSRTIFAGVRFLGLMVSTDGGENWMDAHAPDSAEGFANMVTNRMNTDNVYLATSVGVYERACDNCPWEDINLGLSSRYATALTVSQGVQNLYLGIRKLDDAPIGGLNVRRIQ